MKRLFCNDDDRQNLLLDQIDDLNNEDSNRNTNDNDRRDRNCLSIFYVEKKDVKTSKSNEFLFLTDRRLSENRQYLFRPSHHVTIN